MGKNLYVSNLSLSITESALEKVFAAFGAVSSVKVITDRETGRNKGFGFVEMESDQEATTAISSLNGQVVDGRPIAVSEARPQSSRDNSFNRRPER